MTVPTNLCSVEHGSIVAGEGRNKEIADTVDVA